MCNTNYNCSEKYSRLSTRKLNGVPLRDGPSLSNKILPYTSKDAVHDTIEISLEHVEDGLGRMYSVQDDLMHRSVDQMTPRVSIDGLHAQILGEGEFKTINQDDSISFVDENLNSGMIGFQQKIVWEDKIFFKF